MTNPTPHNCLWFDTGAEVAANAYAETFPGRAPGPVLHAPSDVPGGRAGDVPSVEVTALGLPASA